MELPVCLLISLIIQPYAIKSDDEVVPVQVVSYSGEAQEAGVKPP